MQYFDFHAHIVFKQLFEDDPNIDSLIYSSDVRTIPQICTDLPNIVESQIHQSQLAAIRDEVIVGAVLYGMESALADAVIPLQSYLRPESQAKLSVNLLKAIAQPDYRTFDEFVNSRTLDRYLEDITSFNVLTKASFQGALPTNKVNIFFSVEGCHSFANSTNRATATQGYDPAEIVANLDILLNKGIRIMTVNLTHLQQSNLCNHAFGMQLADPSAFYPTGNGLTDAGRTVAQQLFNRGISVDLKHMSCFSRQNLRMEMQAGKYSDPRPIMCTHAGFTGVALKDWPGFISRKEPVDGSNPAVLYLEVAKTIAPANGIGRPSPGFNMSTINLFNEEIEWIVRSGGMIGLSMDRRILGFVGPHDDRPTGIDQDSTLVVDREYFSLAEWASLQIANAQIGTAVSGDTCVLVSDLEDGAEGDIPSRDEYFYRHILLHIKHFFQVCVNAGIAVSDAQQHLCIGSDFDGLINPFINNATCLQMATLKKYITDNLGDWLQSIDDSQAWANQLDVPAFVEGLFFNNGYNFLKAMF